MTRFLLLALATTAAASPFHGRWAFELSDGNPAWLKVHGDPVEAELLWSIGQPRPVENARIDDGVLSFLSDRSWQPHGDPEQARRITGPFRGEIEEGTLVLTVDQQPKDGGRPETLRLRGTKMPPIPPAPDLGEVEFGERVELFNGEDLSGWKLHRANRKKNGWRVEDGLLVNRTPKTDHGAYGRFGNLVTEREFDDFRLTIEYQLPEGGNSGIYLRGMYEIQVVDGAGQPPKATGPGALYGRITPSENAARPAGEWNRYVLTLVDQHLTVELNGRTVIDNQPVEGCTGGGLSADDTRPGPLLLQGDHTTVRYRDIAIEPVE